MKSLTVALRPADDGIHPMHAFACESPSVDRYRLLERDTDGRRLTLLFQVEGDREPFASRLAAVSNVECAKGTASDLLRRAEARLVAAALGEPS